MKITIPQNIFAALIALYLPDEYKSGLNVKSASLVSKELAEGNCDVALMPSLDLINHKDFFISAKAGIAFDGVLSNSLLYFQDDKDDSLSELYLRGDIATNEILLAKILFSERFETDVNLTIDTSELQLGAKNYLISGNDNLDTFSNLQKGISFADLFAEVLNFPYINFVFAAKEEKHLQKLNELFINVDETIEQNIDSYLRKIALENNVNEFIKNNLSSVYFELTDNEEEGLSELLRLVYYHGIIKDIIDINFVK